MCEVWSFVCSLAGAQKCAGLFVSGIIQYELSSVWLFSLTKMSLIGSCMHPISTVPFDVSTTASPFTFRGCSGCLQVGAAMNKPPVYV